MKLMGVRRACLGVSSARWCKTCYLLQALCLDCKKQFCLYLLHEVVLECVSLLTT